MVQQMPVTDRKKLAELLDRHPFGQELKKRFMLEGKLEETRTAILNFLESRYGEYPGSAAAVLDTIGDLERLKKLRREVFQADTLEPALAAIFRATNGGGGQ